MILRADPQPVRELEPGDTLTMPRGDSDNDYRDLMCVMAGNCALRKKK